MGVGYRLDQSRGFTVVVWDGDVTEDDATSYLMRLAEDLDWPPGPLQLTDLTSAGVVDPAVADPELVAEVVAGNPETRMAILASDTQDVTRRLGMLDTPPSPTFAVFGDLEAACAWLGIDAVVAQVMLEQIRLDLR